mgnify:CR=1 FL=1
MSLYPPLIRKTIQDLALEIALEVDKLTEGREKLIELRDELIQAGYTDPAACKRIAKVIKLDYRTLQKWLDSNGPLNARNRLEVMMFIDAYTDFKKEIKKGETK